MGEQAVSISLTPRGLLTAMSLATFVLGLVAAVATLAPWFQLSFGPVTGRVSGWNVESVSGDLGMGEEDDLSGFTVEDDPASDADIDWIIGSLPDGVPVTFMGMLVAAIGLMLFLRARTPGALATAGRRREVAQLSVTAAVVAAGTLAWTIVSWRRFKGDIDDQIAESLGEDDFGFGAFFLAGFDVEPGWGLLTSATTLGLVVAVCGFGALLALRAQPAGPSVGSPAPSPKPWAPVGEPPPPPHRLGP